MRMRGEEEAVEIEDWGEEPVDETSLFGVPRSVELL
jgi:hypothetical protein